MTNSAVARWIDPVDAGLELGMGTELTRPMLVLAGWVVIASVAGYLLTRRRQVS